eukprot:scaffold201740_cov31-Tisochrysis_lutea.AAC.1
MLELEHLDALVERNGDALLGGGVGGARAIGRPEAHGHRDVEAHLLLFLTPPLLLWWLRGRCPRVPEGPDLAKECFPPVWVWAVTFFGHIE